MKTEAEMKADGFIDFNVQGEQLLAKYYRKLDETVLIPNNDYTTWFRRDLSAMLRILINEDYLISKAEPDCISVCGNILPE